MIDSDALRDRIAGGFLGLWGYGTCKHPRGTWPDDGSLALLLAESIVEKGFDPDDFGRRALAWLDEGPRSARGEAFGPGGAANDDGDGSLMRALPASVWLAACPEPLRFRALAAYSAATHGHPRCLLGAWLHGLVAAALLQGEAPARAYRSAIGAAAEGLPRLPAAVRAESGAYARVLGGDLAGLPRSAIRGSGYVAHCLEASLWCLLITSSYEECALAAVDLGEEADATGTVAGGLAGLAYGERLLPRGWLSSLARAGEIRSLALGLASLVSRPAPLPRSYWILPGKLLAGNYPSAAAEPEARAVLESLLAAGVDASIDLTEEEETGPGKKKLPYAPLAGPAFERRSRPIRDFDAASAETLRGALRDIDELLAAGRTVYLHCWGGTGRTGTVAGSWLVERALAAPDEAIALLKALRAGTDRPEAPSPETEAQRALVLGARPGPRSAPL